MSFLNPIITGGGPSQQSVHSWVTDARHRVGTRAVLPDGRSFYYSANRGSAVSAGSMVAATGISVDFDDLATNTAAEGATVVNVTPVGTATYTANELQGGYLSINSGTTGAGRQYVIESHPATTAATAFDIVLADPIVDEAFNANTTATVVPNPWSDIVVAPTGAAFCVGAAISDIPAGTSNVQYGWVQTWGSATVLSGADGDVVGHTLVKDTGAAGGTLGFVDAAADVTQFIGVNRFTSVDADFMPVFLTIAP